MGRATNRSGASGPNPAMMRPNKQRNTWLAMFDGQEGQNDSQMYEIIPKVSTKKIKKLERQSHTNHENFEESVSHLQGNTAQTSMLHVYETTPESVPTTTLYPLVCMKTQVCRILKPLE